jgi:aspartyl aminopeptidase
VTAGLNEWVTSLLDDLLAFLHAASSPYHAVDEAAQRLTKAGFNEVADTDQWKPSIASKSTFVRRGGALIAWRPPTRKQGWRNGVRIIGAHTDSPNLRVKPIPEVDSAGYTQVGVEVYGGVLNNSWLDRDLGVSGRLVMRDGSSTMVKIDEGIARVSQLAIHLDREVNEKGLVLDKQLHLVPLTGLVASAGPGKTFMQFVCDQADVDADDVVGHDLMFHDVTPPALVGIAKEFIASARIDNLFSCWASVRALIDSEAGRHGQLVALFDHEEVGSSSTTGAAGPLLERVLQRVMHGAGLSIDEQAAALAGSSCVSSDMAHAVHPNYADRHEPQHRPLPNGGPVIKSNANQRYASTADTAALFRTACESANVPVQVFVSKNSMPCGSTIGPITATRLGIDTVDVGCAMLSMHSARELCGAADAELLTAGFLAYFHQ